MPRCTDDVKQIRFRLCTDEILTPRQHHKTRQKIGTTQGNRSRPMGQPKGSWT